MSGKTKQSDRDLVGQYLAHPDPLAWLAMADRLEENCDSGRTCQCKDNPHTCGILARMWRARGTHYAAVLAGYHGAEKLGEKDCFRVVIGSATIDFNTRKKTVRVDVLVSREVPVGSGVEFLFRLHEYVWMMREDSKAQQRYLTQRVLELIDEQREHLKA